MITTKLLTSLASDIISSRYKYNTSAKNNSIILKLVYNFFVIF